jgi:hypothetical protein
MTQQPMDVAAEFAAAGKAAAVAKIEIVMTADGRVSAQAKCPNRAILMGMLEVAKLDLNANLIEQAKKAAEGPKIETPNGNGLLIVH